MHKIKFQQSTIITTAIKTQFCTYRNFILAKTLNLAPPILILLHEQGY